MTPEEKAEQIFRKMTPFVDSKAANKSCALMAVDEVLTELGNLRKPEYTTFIVDSEVMDGNEREEFWEEVKTEINKL